MLGVRPLASPSETELLGGARHPCGMFNWIADRINGAVRVINFLIVVITAYPAPTSPLFVRSPGLRRVVSLTATLAMIGDNAGGARCDTRTESRRLSSNNILAGRRGPAAIPTSSGGPSSAGGGTGGPVTVNLTTGPVMQDQSGQRWMTVEDGERMVRQAVGQMQSHLPHPRRLVRGRGARDGTRSERSICWIFDEGSTYERWQSYYNYSTVIDDSFYIEALILPAYRIIDNGRIVVVRSPPFVGVTASVKIRIYSAPIAVTPLIPAAHRLLGGRCCSGTAPIPVLVNHPLPVFEWSSSADHCTA